MKQFLAIAALIICPLVSHTTSAEDGLVAQWKLATDAKDSGDGEHHAVNHGVQFTDDGAVFDGAVRGSKCLHQNRSNSGRTIFRSPRGSTRTKSWTTFWAM